MKPHHLCLDTQLSVLELFLFKRKFGVFCSKIYVLIIQPVFWNVIFLWLGDIYLSLFEGISVHFN